MIAYTQKLRAEDLIYDYAQSFNHKVNFIEAKPSFGNIIVWKVIYSTLKSIMLMQYDLA